MPRSALSRASKQKSKATLFLRVLLLSLLGKICLCVGSFHLFTSAFLLWPRDRSFLLRASVILLMGAALLVAAMCSTGTSDWRSQLFRSLPPLIIGYASLGLIAALLHVLTQRQPHSLTPYEIVLLSLSLVVFVLVVLFSRRDSKRRKNAKLLTARVEPI